MSHLIELAESHGLVSPERIEATLSKLSKTKLTKLAQETVEALVRDEPVYVGPEQQIGANLLVSSSLRSDSGCRAWVCRRKKLEALARYAALYADHLLLPVPLESFLAPPESLRLSIGDLYYKHSILRPLFEVGLARFAVDMYCLCQECGRHFDAICQMHYRAAFEFYTSKLGQIRVVYRPPFENSPWYVEISGPEAYFEHGSIHLVPTDRAEVPDWAPKRITKVDGGRGALLSAARIRKNRIGGTIIAELSRDAVFQQYHGVRHGANYVTDSVLESEFLERIYPRDRLDDSIRTLLTEMQHTIPLLSELPLRRVLGIRRNEYESFQLYRGTISSLVKDHLKAGSALTPRQAKELCADVLAPQILRLQIEARARATKAIKKAVARAVVPAAMLTVGLISGLVPRALSELFKWGGIALSGQLAEALATIEKNPTAIRNQNLYFLLRLCQSNQ